MTCPTCSEPLEEFGCPTCEAIERFEAPVGLLLDFRQLLAGGRVPLGQARLDHLVSHVTGAVQQLLDSVREHLDENLRRVDARVGLVEQDGMPGVLEILDRFRGVQAEVDECLCRLAEALGEARSLGDLARSQVAVEEVTARLQAALADLAALEVEAAHPELTGPVGDPMSEEIAGCLEHVSMAMGSLDLYIEERDRDALTLCQVHLDRAREAVAQALARVPEA